MLYLCGLCQMVGVDQGITGVLENGKQVEGFFEPNLTLPGGSSSVGPSTVSLCRPSVTASPRLKPPMARGIRTC
jgi:hypothetical protein